MKTLIVAYIELKWYSLDINDQNSFETNIKFDARDVVITFQKSDFIREVSANKWALPTIIDIETLDKQMSQEGKDMREYQKWRIFDRLVYHKICDTDFKLTKETIKLLLEHIGSLHKKLMSIDKLELKRYNEVEVKINSVIHQTQRLGVGVNSEVLEQRCKELERQIYDAKNTLQLEHNIFSPDYFETQKEYLNRKKYSLVKSLLYSFKIRSKTDVICNLFYNLLRDQNDLDSLLFIMSHWGGAKRTHPTYLGFGTITSRIIVRQPSLQNLRKTNRDIIAPDNGTRLIYIDYAQFEAGILASLSNDKALIKLYSSDIYSDLAQYVLNNKDERDEAKIIFYRYMYGDTSLPKNATLYFQKFKDLQKFKETIEKELLSNKRIGTSFGNYRRSLDDETTWALSHKVQATASYIYKSALIRVAREVKAAHFLLPMHDATLYQIDIVSFEQAKIQIESIYKEEFKKACPQINPIMNISEKF